MIKMTRAMINQVRGGVNLARRTWKGPLRHGSRSIWAVIMCTPRKTSGVDLGFRFFCFGESTKNSLLLKPELRGTRIKENKKNGISSKIIILACLRLLRTGYAYYRMEDGCKMAEETLLVYFIKFGHGMKRQYGDMYLNRRPSKPETMEIENDYNEAVFMGFGGWLDCMKLRWKNCPFTEKG